MTNILPLDLEDPSGKNRKRVEWKKPLLALLVVVGLVFYLGSIHNEHGTEHGTTADKPHDKLPPQALLHDPSTLLNDDEVPCIVMTSLFMSYIRHVSKCKRD